MARRAGPSCRRYSYSLFEVLRTCLAWTGLMKQGPPSPGRPRGKGPLLAALETYHLSSQKLLYAAWMDGLVRRALPRPVDCRNLLKHPHGNALDKPRFA